MELQSFDTHRSQMHQAPYLTETRYMLSHGILICLMFAILGPIECVNKQQCKRFRMVHENFEEPEPFYVNLETGRTEAVQRGYALQIFHKNTHTNLRSI